MALLTEGDELCNSDRSARYRVGHQIGEGAFGEAHAAVELDQRNRPIRDVCVKVVEDSTSWHGESYFGSLLADEQRVVSWLDSFPHQVGSGMGTRMLFLLVFELEQQTVEQYFAGGGTPWTEAGAHREFLGLLKMLELLHSAGASHRDIKPDNVFVAPRRRVKLGDFGIAEHALGARSAAVTLGTPQFMPASLRNYARRQWLFSDDLYQLGLLTATLLTGEIATEVNSRQLTSLGLDAAFDGTLRRCVGPRNRRFEQASHAIAELTGINTDVLPPDSLSGRRVVFTGALPIERTQARTVLAQVGGEFREDVNGMTDVLVVGSPSPLYSERRRGDKLAAAYRRIKDGQQISILGWAEFERLAELA